MMTESTYNWLELSQVFKNVIQVVDDKGTFKKNFIDSFKRIGLEKLFEQLIISDNLDYHWKLDYDMTNLLFGNSATLITYLMNCELKTEIKEELIDFFDLCDIVIDQKEGYSKIGITYEFQYVTPRNFQGKPLKLSSKINSAQLFCELIPFRNMPFNNIENISTLYQYIPFQRGNQKYVCITLKNSEEREVKSAINTLAKLHSQLRINVDLPLKKGSVVGTYLKPNNHVIKIRSIQPPLNSEEDLLIKIL
jgi:hypothetical protein